MLANEAYRDLISQVNELIKYYRQYVVPKAGKVEEETEESENGDPSTPSTDPSTDSDTGTDTGSGTVGEE